MISSWQLHAGRVSLGLSVNALARAAEVAPNSILNIEDGRDFKASTMEALEAALKAEGVLFAPGRVGVRMQWEGQRPSSRETREAVLSILNASRKAKGQAPFVDCEDAR